MVELFPIRTGPAPKVEPEEKGSLSLADFIAKTRDKKQFTIEYTLPNSEDHIITTAIRNVSQDDKHVGLPFEPKNYTTLMIYDFYKLNPEDKQNKTESDLLKESLLFVDIASIIALRFEGRRYNYDSKTFTFEEEDYSEL